MAQLDRDDNDIRILLNSSLNDEYNDDTSDDVPEPENENLPRTLDPKYYEEYRKMAQNANETSEQYLIFVRDDAKEPMTPITIDFMYKIVSINKEHEKNTIIEMRDFSGVGSKHQIFTRVYQKDDPDVLNDVIETPYLLKKPINKWVHMVFRYEATKKKWTAYYNTERWFDIEENPNFSPDTLNYIKIYTKIPYAEGGNFEAYIANVTITTNDKPMEFYPPYPRDYGPIFVGGPIKFIRYMWRDTRVNIIEEPNIILWWPVRSPIDIFEYQWGPGFEPTYVFHPFPYGIQNIQIYNNFPPQLYGGFWHGIPAIGPGHPTIEGIVTFRRGNAAGIPLHQDITIESWVYIDYTKNDGQWIVLSNFVGENGVLVKLCFNGITFRLYNGETYWNIDKGNYVNKWIHVAFSYVMFTQKLMLFIDGICVHTVMGVLFSPIDIVLHTHYLEAGMRFYFTGFRVTAITKYLNNFDTLVAVYPPYTIFPGDPKYPVYPPSLPSPSAKSDVVFRYPVSLDSVIYESNSTYSLVTDSVSLTNNNGENSTYRYPIVTNTVSNKTMEVNFIDSERYRVPTTYTLEYWLYVTEPYDSPTELDSGYINYDFMMLRIGSNGVYFGLHQKGSDTMSFTKTFSLELGNKWNHIAMTCEYQKDFALFVNGKKIYNQSKANELFNIYQLYMDLCRSDADNKSVNICNITMVDHIKYRFDFDYTILNNRPIETV